MQDTSRARVWGSRAAVVVAAFACLATSQASWTLEAKPPAGAPTSTPASGKRGLLVTVEATREPRLACKTDVGDLYPPGDKLGDPAADAGALSLTEFFCPPGGTLEAVSISGKGGEGNGACSRPRAPAGERVRITKVETVEGWAVTAEARPPVRIETGGATYSAVKLTIRTTGVLMAEVRAALEPGSAAGFGAPVVENEGFDALTPDAGGRTQRLLIRTPTRDGKPPSKPLDGTVTVRATVRGRCRVPCDPPRDAVAIEVDAP
jgi:hypothetical protein